MLVTLKILKKSNFKIYLQKRYDWTDSQLWKGNWKCWFEIQEDYNVRWFYRQPCGKRTFKVEESVDLLSIIWLEKVRTIL